MFPGLLGWSSVAPAARARRRVEVRGKGLDVDVDQLERRARGRLVVGGDGGDRLAAVADAAARERELVLRNRNDAVRHVAVVAGDHRADARQRACRLDVDLVDLAVRDRAPQDRADERAGRLEVRRVAGATGDLLDAVDERLAHADHAGVSFAGRRAFHGGVSRIVHVAATACTDSMIFT